MNEEGKGMNEDGGKPRDLRLRTREFALSILRIYGSLPKSNEAQTLGRQLLRSGTSVGAHYREAWRSRSGAEFISKLEVALQELDETGYWLELFVEGKIMDSPQLRQAQSETDELIKIFVTAVKSAKSRI